MEDQSKNLLLAVLLSAVVILGWSVMFPAETPTPSAKIEQSTSVTPEIVPAPAASPSVEKAITAVSTADRVTIETPNINGSISLAGARIDDIELTQYRDTLDADSANVRLLSPVGSEHAYYVLHGWLPVAGTTADALPSPETIWTLADGDKLTPQTPITLTWDNGAGLTFERTISVDDKFMFNIEQKVINTSDQTVSLAPYGVIARHGEPDTVNFFILHEGVVGMTDETLHEFEYDDIADLSSDKRKIAVETEGWLGFTDKYWMTTLIPDHGFSARTRVTADIYRTEAVHPQIDVAPGATATATERLFAGAKEWATIKSYQDDDGITGFLDSIDWGWFFFLTKPIFWVLHHLNTWIGNMGWSIIALTFLLKALLFPLAYKSYASMARMRELQPQMEKLKEQAGDDREKLQKGMMELYKKNKVNPAAGCLPLLLQIPIFFSLYKVIFVTIELRHAPWIGWIRDLSAPDPTSFMNLFGLLPWGTPEIGSTFAFISIGILPILMGITMFLQQKLNPAPPDPTQRMIFAWMPWVFMFMLGGFASGLVIYWITNNTITFVQQYLIMRSHGYTPNVIGNIFGGADKDQK